MAYGKNVSLWTCGIQMVLAVITGLLRIYTRAFIVRSFGIDDALAAFSLVRCRPVPKPLC